MPYYGLYPISKGWHGVRQMPMKGSYNFLAVDERFVPWLFLIRSSSEDLLQKIPELIEKAKRIGEQAGVSRQRLDQLDRKSTRLNSSHSQISYAVFCLKKKKSTRRSISPGWTLPAGAG